MKMVEPIEIDEKSNEKFADDLYEHFLPMI